MISANHTAVTLTEGEYLQVQGGLDAYAASISADRDYPASGKAMHLAEIGRLRDKLQDAFLTANTPDPRVTP